MDETGQTTTRQDEPVGQWTSASHRPEVLRRLVQRGVSPRTLQLLWPGWDQTIAAALETRSPGGQDGQ